MLMSGPDGFAQDMAESIAGFYANDIVEHLSSDVSEYEGEDGGEDE